MKMKQVMAAVAAASLVATPVVAQAAASQRVASPVEEAENLQGGWLVPVIAIIAVLLGVLAATSGGDDLPTSP